MKINIASIPEEGMSVQFSLAGDLFSDLVADQEQFAFTLHKVEVTGAVRKSRQSVFFSGMAETILETMCCRCLDQVQLPIKADFQYTLMPEVKTGKEEMELQAEDLDVSYYSAEIIDLPPMIAEQIILQIPMKVLCRDACRGLCPSCGVNLNLVSCDCRSNFMDARLAVLKKFKV